MALKTQTTLWALASECVGLRHKSDEFVGVDQERATEREPTVRACTACLSVEDADALPAGGQVARAVAARLGHDLDGRPERRDRRREIRHRLDSHARLDDRGWLERRRCRELRHHGGGAWLR